MTGRDETGASTRSCSNAGWLMADGGQLTAIGEKTLPDAMMFPH
jgi:hypothetical protein